MKTKSFEQELKLCRAFCSLKRVQDLCYLLKIEKRQLMLLVKQPKYRVFEVPKKSGGKRLIETPSPVLKKLQSILNRYLQSVYYFEKSSASFGFVLNVSNDEDRRNVVTNAQKHLGKPFMLNIDLKDFFHSVTYDKVEQLFRGTPFYFTDELAETLAQLTTYQERLPMGTPTSPVLSNLACRNIDEKLMTYAADQKIVYTRYADDMSFSSVNEITAEQVEAITSIIQEAGFEVNPEKIKLFGEQDTKVVTGLVIAKKVELAPEFIPNLTQEISQLHHIMTIQNQQGELSTIWVEQFKLQIRGRLSFAGFVLGYRNKSYQQLKDAFYTAINPPEDDFSSVSWRSFPYNR